MTPRHLILLLGLFLANGAAGQTPHHPDCRDDHGVDRCAPDQQARVRALFGVQPVEAHRDAGDQVRRAFYVNGYGHDLVAIVFIRTPGHDPQVRVYFPRVPNETPLEPLTAPVPQPVWDDIIRRSAHFDRQLVALPEQPEPTGSGDAITLCIHSWVYTVEASDPAGYDEPERRLRRRTEDGCDNGLTEAYAVELERAALALFPQCDILDRRQHRGEAGVLQACGMFSGDRIAAAEARNAINPLLYARRAEDADSITGLFEFESVVDWAGERQVRILPEAMARWWMAKAGGAGSADFYLDSIEGLAADRVRVRGGFARWVTVQGQRDPVLEAATAELILTGSNGYFSIASATIGRFERVRR